MKVKKHFKVWCYQYGLSKKHGASQNTYIEFTDKNVGQKSTENVRNHAMILKLWKKYNFLKTESEPLVLRAIKPIRSLC